ncbi:GntR family transcriptional regulator [Thiolapillus sp.]
MSILSTIQASGTLSEQVFEALREAIVSGDIAAGSKISEPELAKRYEVSRASLREAISRLEACNLVTRRANVGARVVSLSLEELLEIYRVREALEGMAARLAATQMSDAQLQRLQRLLNEAPGFDPTDINHDFHHAIVMGSNNRRLQQLLCNDLYHLMRMYRQQFGRGIGQSSSASREHQMIMDALNDRDDELAELLMRRHIRRSCEHTRCQIERRQENAS